MTIHRDNDSLRRQDARSAQDSASPNEDALPSHDHDSSAPVDRPLPRPERRRRRAKSDRGLPPDEELAKLATAYLEHQRDHWPKLVEAGLLPEPTKAVIRRMIEDFKLRHRTGRVDVDTVRPYAKVVARLAGLYARYSCDNSSPTSVLDQMVKCLDKAQREDRFIPWAYVFSDYSVTGLDASRQGYSSYKAILTDDDHLIDTTYIDDFTRASRDEIEWWKLARLSKRLNKRLIGASDGFDLNDPNSDLLITMFGLVSRLFIKGLREKVKRGMRGAARRGTCLGKLSLGLTRRVHRDENGAVVYRPDGRPRHEPCIDPTTKEHRLLLYELFVDKGWSAHKIARHFNKLKVDGSDGWTPKAIKQLLWNPNAIGVFIWNRTRREFDGEREKWVVVENPRSEWEIYYDPNLAIVPSELWRAARRKLAAMRRNSPRTGRKPSRNQVSATTLFSGTLFCEYCMEHDNGDGELKLIRSTPKYKQMGCLNGVAHAHGCTLSRSKSTKIIEERLLGYLRDALLTEKAVEDLIVQANACLEAEAKKPRVNTGPLRAKARKLEAKIKKLVTRVEDEPDEQLCNAYDQRIKELQKDLQPLRDQILQAEQLNRRKKAKPIKLDRCKAYLADLRGLLNQETPMAAEVIRSLTGPIKIRQEPNPDGKRGDRWIATFSPDLMRLLRRVVQDKDTPDSVVLANAEPAEPETVELEVEKIPKYERLAPKFKQLRDNGASVQSIAAAYGMSWQYAAEILRFADTGERPEWNARKRPRRKASKRNGAGSNAIRYIEIAEEVAHLRDKKKMSIVRIAAKLGVSRGTVCRAYDHEHPQAIREAAERGEPPCRGQYSNLGEDVYDEIRKLLRAGTKPSEIAAKVGCGTSTVNRVRRKMRAETGEDRAT